MEKYIFRFSTSAQDIKAAQRLRGEIFRKDLIDADSFDSLAIHGLLFRAADQRLVATFRMLPIEDQAHLGACYSAKYYDLSMFLDKEHATVNKNTRLLELGRFCIAQDIQDPDVLRLLWGNLAHYIFDHNIDVLFGCTSFHGTDIEAHKEALALLKEHYLVPKLRMPKIKAPKVFEFAKFLARMRPNLPRAQKTMPPLLRSYLMMGARVSDHAVIDHDLNSLHVFTCVDVQKLPQDRKRIFARLAGVV